MGLFLKGNWISPWLHVFGFPRYSLSIRRFWVRRGKRGANKERAKISSPVAHKDDLILRLPLLLVENWNNIESLYSSVSLVKCFVKARIRKYIFQRTFHRKSKTDLMSAINIIKNNWLEPCTNNVFLENSSCYLNRAGLIFFKITNIIYWVVTISRSHTIP